jgi:hypothetical protein
MPLHEEAPQLARAGIEEAFFPPKRGVAATKLCIAEKLRKQKQGIYRPLRSCSVIQSRENFR